MVTNAIASDGLDHKTLVIERNRVLFGNEMDLVDEPISLFLLRCSQCRENVYLSSLLLVRENGIKLFVLKLAVLHLHNRYTLPIV